MKHLKSTSGDLRRLFEQAISVREVAEPLVSFDEEEHPETILAFMDERNFDVVGVRENGKVIGYVRRDALTQAKTLERICRFSDGEVLSEKASLLAAIEGLKARTELFISAEGHIAGIVTKGDLQKTPVRLWLFGIISLIEMQMLRVIRIRFPDLQWMEFLKKERLEEAKNVFAKRQRRNQEANASDFSDCLQICDKRDILLKASDLITLTGCCSKKAAEKLFSSLESLRNDLAHSNDILDGRWPQLIDTVTKAEELLVRLESYSTNVSKK